MELQSNEAGSSVHCTGNPCIVHQDSRYAMLNGVTFSKCKCIHSLNVCFFLLLFSKIMIDGRDKNAVDVDGGPLPTLVYVAREKRPQWPHNFKAGAVNALVIQI